MDLKDRIAAFSNLGDKLQHLSPLAFKRLARETEDKNPWFTPENIQVALKNVIKILHKESLEQWTSNYSLSPNTPKTIGVVMAGNIPLVGFHDLLSVLISGHILQAKLSTQDSILPAYIAKELIAIEYRFAKMIFFESQLSKYDAVIATGSNNTARYFKYYFKNMPHIIRKSRSSCAILSRKETLYELEKLGEDVFQYFGLGCRNVSKIYLPKDYNLTPLLKAWKAYKHVALHHKYANNYNYQKSILLINQQHLIDNGIVLLVKSEKLVSPISVVYYEEYNNSNDLQHKIDRHKNELQCVVAHPNIFAQGVPFGETQYPKVWNYSDNVDTLKFITDLN